MSIFERINTSACVSCSVKSCVHHGIANVCTAEHIDIGGKNAKTGHDTLCRTYCRKDSPCAE
ncbi:MAG: DUF1540 domain-containing protein [Clostridiales bacterium]|jgi:hypothetical protein|nr:DUF1540 domain-containing protein [Clostridiales bacterium]